MKNIFLFMLSAFFLLFSVACQPNEDNQQLINTLIESYKLISQNNKVTLYKLENISNRRTHTTPLYNAGYKIYCKAKNLDDALQRVITQFDTTDIDYPKLFADYTAFYAFSKDILLAIQDSSENN